MRAAAPPRRVHGYIRVSGQEQANHGTSLDGQREALLAYCRRAGFPVPQIHVEVESGSAEKQERRVELAELLRSAEPGDLIVCPKVDRWSRDLPWGVSSVRALIKRGIGWHSTDEGIDASTEQGDSTLGIMAWAADQERKRIRRRMVGRREELRDKGLHAEGLPPFGLRRGRREERRHLTLEPVPEDAPLVAEAYRRCVRGDSLRILSLWLAEERPARHWSPKVMRDVLRNRLYCGEVRTSAGWVAAHEAIVTRAIFEAAADALKGRRKGGAPHTSPWSEQWILRGLCRCALCGASMVAAYGKKNKGGEPAGYYTCARRAGRNGWKGAKCMAPFVPAHAVNAEGETLLLARIHELRDALLGEAPAPAAQGRGPAEWEAARARLRAKRERLIDLAADGTLDRAALRARLDAVDAEQGRLAAREASEGKAARVPSSEERLEMLRAVDGIRSAWGGMTVGERREVFGLWAAGIVMERGVPLRVTWRTAEELAAAGA